MKKAELFFFPVAATLALWCAPAAASDWPQFRGPNRDGKSPETGLLKEWPTEGPKQLWKFSGVGLGYSSAAIADGTVYVTGGIDGNLVITALDLNGREKWKKVHGPVETGQYPGSRSTVTVDGKNFYVSSCKGLLTCYDAKTAAPLWSKDLNKDFGGRDPGWSRAESPLVYNNMVVVSPGGGNTIVALNKLTGQTVWTSKGLNEPAAHASPVAVEFMNLPMIVTMTMKGLVAVDARTGQFLWRNDRPANKTANCPSPVYQDGYVFEATGYNNGGACIKLSVEGGQLQAVQAWETKDMVCHHGGYVIVDGYIYGNHSDGWNCLDLKTGEKKWGDRGVGKGSVIYADGMLYTYSERRGRIALVEAKPEGFKSKGEFSVDGSAESWAHPAISGGRLFLRFGDNLYCFDIRGPNYKEETEKKPEAKPEVKTAVKPQPPKPLPPPPPPLPNTPEEQARRLWVKAENFFLNGADAAGTAVLKEIVDKYPDTEYGKKAAEKLKEVK